MTPSDLDRRAELTIWPKGKPARAAEGRPFATLREALAVAIAAMESGEAQPWIITEAGDILSPRWIQANSRARRRTNRRRAGGGSDQQPMQMSRTTCW
ncbi:hypothetical protein SAMN02799636_04875 [Methylobacterium sp. 275MFSha3.1]|uniref:hypothetical protein n=1 Tax=Methylobacterium sp. 275MFSha3.1 TaxID=1502746 RepID=UPI0008A78B1E|nr:hypothetical protein [Methylobacterium sp. 275MFSha3.1]SEI00090.1 hypothetical protein SAMN02799636_04875 [Methylobacterium sp. 275MFSha3.1]